MLFSDEAQVYLVGLLAWLIIERDKQESDWYDSILDEAEEFLNQIDPKIIPVAREDLARLYAERARGG